MLSLYCNISGPSANNVMRPTVPEQLDDPKLHCSTKMYTPKHREANHVYLNIIKKLRQKVELR